MSEFRNELVRIFKSPKLVFTKGMMSKANDNLEGYVSDLTNMEIDSEGVAKRRMGSFCLLNPDDDREWILYFVTKISGCDLIFLVDYSGNIYCVSENYPEKIFTLNKSGFTKLYYPDTDTFSYEARFDRGTKFFYVDRPESLTMMNDFGDTITINKNGSIRFLGTSGQQESYETAIRKDFDSITWDTYGVYVNLKYTHKKIINTFDLIRTTAKTYDPQRKFIPAINSIQGEVKVAQVDSDGRIGRCSPAQFISRYGEYIVSLVSGYTVEGTCFWKRGITDFSNIKTPNYPQENSKRTRIFARRVNEDTTTATLADVDVECKDLPYAFSSTSFSDSSLPKRRACMFGIHPDNIEDPKREFVKATMWLDYNFTSGNETAALREFCPDNIGCLLKAVSVRAYRTAFDNVPDTAVLSANVTDSTGLFIADNWNTTGVGCFSTVDIEELPVYVIKAKYCEVIPYKYGANIAPVIGNFDAFINLKSDTDENRSGILFEVTIGLPKNYINTKKMKFSLFKADGNSLIDQNAPTGIRTTEFVDLLMGYVNFKEEDAVPVSFYPAQWMYDVPNSENLLVGLKNIGYDCWEAKRGLKMDTDILSYANKFDINIMGKMTAKDGLTEDEYGNLAKSYDIVVDQAEYDEWFKNGTRFAVMNDSKVIGVSQRCFANSEDLVPVYKQNVTVSAVRDINYQDEIDMVGYLPVCAIENIYIRGFIYDSPSIQKDVDKAKDIVENSGSVFLLENGRIWIGSNIESLVFNATTNLPDTANSIAKFDTGVLAFCKDSVKFVYPNGKFTEVQGLHQFKNATCVKAKWLPDGSVYAITSEGEIARISIQYTENNDKFYMAHNISHPISDVIFTHETDIAYSNNTIWFSRINDVYGFRRNGWMSRVSFGDNIIKGIFTYKDELCIIFNNGIPKGRTKIPGLQLVELITG